MDKNDIRQVFENRAKKIKNTGGKNKKVFLHKQRMKLLSGIEGSILEVAVGRGNNFKYYDCKSNVVGVDFSPTLLEMAKVEAEQHHLNVQLIDSDVEHLAFDANSFDIIVSTLTLCSYDDPVKVLDDFSKWCRPDGRILLLEHGISANQTYGKFLNKILNGLDSWCIKNMGDHINRDIPGIIKEANIEIERIETCLMDTHYLIWARPIKLKKVMVRSGSNVEK